VIGVVRDIWLRFYLSKLCHFLFLVFLAVFIAILYLWSHQVGWHDYWDEVKRAADNSFQVFRVSFDKTGQRLALLAAGEEIDDVKKLPVTPFGLEKVGSIQGTLSQYKSLAVEANGVYDSLQQDFLHHFSDRRGYFALAVSYFGLTNIGVEFRLPNSRFTVLQQTKGLAFQRGFYNAMAGPVVFDPASILPGGRSAATGTNNGPEAKIQQAAAETLEAGQRRAAQFLAGEFSVPLGDVRPSSTNELAALGQLFDRWNRIALDVFPAGTNATSFQSSLAETNSVWLRLGAVNNRMREELVANLQSETQPLWLIGRFRWLEILYWVWFGVLTHSLVSQGASLVGGRSDEVWQPGEILRIVAKFAYAPALVLALFFLASLLGAEAAALEFGRNSWATLGIAFTLGMFPNTIYRLLRQFLTTIFRTELTQGDRIVKEPGTAKVVVDRTHREGKQAYNLDTLKANVAELITAPLKDTTS